MNPAALPAARYKVILHVGDGEPAKWNVALNNMLPGIGYVTAGVVELMQRQREGYAYIRP